MILPLIVSEEAQEDLADARTWYEARGVKLGADFVKCVDEAFEGIRKTPALHAKL